MTRIHLYFSKRQGPASPCHSYTMLYTAVQWIKSKLTDCSSPTLNTSVCAYSCHGWKEVSFASGGIFIEWMICASHMQQVQEYNFSLKLLTPESPSFSCRFLHVVTVFCQIESDSSTLKLEAQVSAKSTTEATIPIVEFHELIMDSFWTRGSTRAQDVQDTPCGPSTLVLGLTMDWPWADHAAGCRPCYQRRAIWSPSASCWWRVPCPSCCLAVLLQKFEVRVTEKTVKTVKTDILIYFNIV